MDIKVENFQGRLTKQYPNIYATLIKGDAHMRKSIVLAAAAALLPAIALSAEVTLYGKVNTAFYFEDWSDSSANVSMINEGSRFGLNIREKLNDEWSVKSYLENGFNSDTGAFTNTGGGNTSSTLFDRRSILALASEKYGEFAFGRMGSVRTTMAPYAMTLAWLDPMETNYAEAGMSHMFGNDPRSNNTITYVSPRISGFRFGASYSLAFTDQESDSTSKDNRLLALALNYENGAVGIYTGATQIWYGLDTSTGLADSSKAIDRKDAQAYTLGATWATTDSLKLFVAGQYQKNWRSVAGWNMDSASTHATAYSLADREHGIDGWSGLLGLQYKLPGSVRLLAKYVYFDGDHKMADGSKLGGQRHGVHGGIEHVVSKRTKLYAILYYFTGEDEMDVRKLTGMSGQFGLEHNF